jgi:hypothetical protein
MVFDQPEGDRSEINMRFVSRVHSGNLFVRRPPVRGPKRRCDPSKSSIGERLSTARFARFLDARECP